MLKKIFLPALFIVIATRIQAQSAARTGEFLADSLLSHKSYFVLRNKLTSLNLQPNRQQYYQACVYNFFNQSDSSNMCIDRLLHLSSNGLSLTEKIRMVKLSVFNHLRLYHYRKAYEKNDVLLKNYASQLTPTELEDAEELAPLLKSLLDVPPQRISIKRDEEIKCKKDLAGLNTIPVRISGDTEQFIFDTGANFSVISESNADKNQLELGNNYFAVRAITGKRVAARIGIATQMHVGEIECTHVVFLVFPDSTMSFANGKYVINGIIGLPVIEQMQEVHISKGGSIMIPKKPTQGTFSNLGLDELTPVVNMEMNGLELPCTFDTGAQVTVLNGSYYTLFKNDVDANGTPQKIPLGGIGGYAESKGFLLPEWRAAIGQKKVHLKNVMLKAEAPEEQERYYYANIGQDVIRQYDKMIINFNRMFLTFSN